MNYEVDGIWIEALAESRHDEQPRSAEHQRLGCELQGIANVERAHPVLVDRDHVDAAYAWQGGVGGPDGVTHGGCDSRIRRFADQALSRDSACFAIT